MRAMWLALIGLLSVGCASSSSHPSASESLRVMTYNIHHAAGEDGSVDIERIARIVNAQQPDLVAIQEVDVGTKRTNNLNTPAELERLTGLHARFGKAIDWDGGAFGQVILSKRPITSFTVHKLPGDPKREQRIALEAIIDGGAIRFVATHLDHSGQLPDRLAQAKELNRLFGQPDGVPTILAGDFNAKPGTDAIVELSQHFTDASATRPDFTYPSTQPTRKIDWVFLREPKLWTVTNTEVIDEPAASDHRPLVVELKAK
ncbi:MAG: endonuclease/exonuclease/phosphatase family protein [Tepidisphaeraceae bacterium]